MLKRILFFGNERLATGLSTKTPVLRELIDKGYEVVAIVAAQNETGPSRQQRSLEISQLAAEHNIDLLQPDSPSAIERLFNKYPADIGVLAAYGRIVPPEIIKMLPKGIVNIHPSLLPKHRGPTPIESVILGGDKQTGVSLMELAHDLDSGPLYGQVTVDLAGNESKQALADQLAQLGAELLVSKLPAIIEGSLVPEAQNDALATYDKKIEKTDGVLDFAKPATKLEREVRAYAGWPRSRTTINQFEVVITKAHVISGDGQPGSLYHQANELGFYTSEAVLMIDELIPAGKKNMPAAAFLAGYNLTP